MPTTTYYKRSATGTTSLNSNTAWDSTSAGGSGQFGPPADINNDIAQWDTTSLGAGLTGAFTANQIVVNGAASAIAHSSGTITLGTGGFTQAAPANTRTWTETGVLAVGSNNQTWALYNDSSTVATPAYAVTLGTSALTGSATITLTNAGGSGAIVEKALLQFPTAGANAGFTGTIDLGDKTGIYAVSGTSLANGTLKITGSGVELRAGSGSGSTMAFGNIKAANTINLRGPNGATFSANWTTEGASPISIDAINNNFVLLGTISGAQPLTKIGTRVLIVNGDWTGLPSPLTVSAGGFTSNLTTNNTFTGVIAGAGTFTKDNTGTLTLTNNTISVTTLTHNAGTLEFSPAVSQSVSSAIGGAGAITKSGAGTTTFSGAGSNTGAWAVNAGTLTITAAQSATAGAIAVASGGTLTNSGAGTIAKPITVNSGGSGTFDGTISGTALTFNRGSTVAINAASGASGGTTTINGTGVTFGSGAFTSQGSFYVGTDTGVTTLTVPANRTITTGTNRFFQTATTATSRAAVYQQGNITNTGGGTGAPALFGAGAGTSAYAYWRGSGGTFATGNSTATFLGMDAGGAGGAPSVADIDGTTLSIYRLLGIGNGSVASSSMHILSGTHTLTIGAGSNDSLSISGSGLTGAATTQHRLTIQGASTTFTATPLLIMGGNASGGLNQINLRDGATLTVGGGALTGATPKQINLVNGSTFATTAAITNTTGTFTLGLYGNGNKISSGTSATAVLPAAITQYDATTTGVTSITNAVGNAGSGYIGPPVVVLSGGGGVGASARAVWDPATQKITGFEVTNPGSGYTSAPTVQLSGATLANGCCTTEVNPALITVNIGANASDGAIEKLGTGTLTLTGTNTNTGAYKISAGTLQIGAGGTSTSGTLGAGTGYGESPVILNGGTLAFARNQNISYAGVISDGPSVTATSGIKKVATTAVSTVTLTGNSTFTGPISVEHGGLQATAPTALGSLSATTSITVANAAQVTFAFGAGVSVVSARGASLTGAGSQGALFASTGSTTLTGAVTITSTNNGATLDANNNAVIELAGVVSSGASATLTKGTNPGTLRLTNPANTLAGPIVVNGGTLSYKWAADTGASNSLGAGASNTVTVNPNGCLDYCGDFWGTTNRSLTLGTTAANQTVTLSASGDGPITYRQAPAVPSPTSGTKTLVLGGSSGKANKIDFVIPTYTGVSLAKRGNGTWVLSQANTFTTNVAVEQGTLVAASEDGTARFGAANNTQTVTVSTGAKIQTLTGTLQKGRHTYNNLTFQSSGKIRIGGSVSSGSILMNANLDLSGLAISQKVTWNLTDPMYKTNGTYDLVVFASGTLALPGSANPATATLSDYITVAPPSGKQAALSWVAATSSTRAKITVAITNVA